jgi:DNA-binding CsgD family transcriptional regulator
MCAQIDPKAASLPLTAKAAIELIEQVRSTSRADTALDGNVFADLASMVVENLGVDRCLIFLNIAKTEPFEPVDNLLFSLAAESRIDQLSPLSVRTYDFGDRQGVIELFSVANSVPLRDLQNKLSDPTRACLLEGFLSECQSESIVGFPLLLHGKVLGCLSMHFLNRPVPEVYLEIGQTLADELVSELEDTSKVGRMAELSQQARRNDDIVQTLSRRLNLERWARKLIGKMHSSMDRDVLLQQVVDGLGTGLKASRCIIVRTDGSPPKMVTHEYGEPEISPLGLGRTNQVPPRVIDYFREDVNAFSDLADLAQLPGVSAADLKSLNDNAIKALAGAPISRQGTNFGVIVLLQCDSPKRWTSEELEMLVLIAEQTAIALGNCESVAQLKDQLFHMNLMGNLTQQLTNTLELVSKNLRPSDEKAQQAVYTAPLSFRELEVLKLIASGYANREIAKRLFLTESTVELHASRIRKKLNLKSRTALVKYACDNALV